MSGSVQSTLPLALARFAAVGGMAAALAPVQHVLNAGWPRGGERLARRFHDWSGAILGIERRVIGVPSARRPTLFVANHVSYLDVSILGAVLRTSFVAKREIAGWPVIGGLARLQRTLFIARARAEAPAQVAALRARLAAGDNLVLFPEGTSGDGTRVLDFKSSLFALAERLPDGTVPVIQPVTLAYRALNGAPLDAHTRPRVAWYGEMTLLPHLAWLAGAAALSSGLAVELGFDAPVAADAFVSRKELAAYCRQRVAAGLAAALAAPAWWRRAMAAEEPGRQPQAGPLDPVMP